MRFWAIFILYCMTFAVLAWSFNLISTEVHEQTHVAIFNNYNISSTIHVNWWTGSGYTSPNHEEYILYCNEMCKFSQSLNEITGYNINVFIFAMMCTAFIIGLVVILVVSLQMQEDRDSFYEGIIDDLAVKLNQQNDGGEEPFAELSDLTE